MPPCLRRGTAPGSPTIFHRLGLLCLLLGGRGSTGCGALHLAAAFQGNSMLTTPAATLAVLGRGRACFCGPAVWRGGSRGRRRSRPSQGAAAMLSTAREEGLEAAAQEEERRVRGMIPSMSPSSISAFKQCPQLFYYRYILRLKPPPTLETLKGIAVHEVLAQYFTLEESRDLERLHELFRGVMGRLIRKDKEDPSRGFSTLFKSQEKEKRWVVECLDLVANFVTMERQVQDASWEGDPVHVELRMEHTFREGGAGAGPTQAQDVADAAGFSGDGAAGGEEAGASAMRVTGIVDRLDRCADGTLRVVDYKTGKVPELKYPEATNKRIMDDKFFQLQIYALLVERVLGEAPGEMRLVYLKGTKSVTRKVDKGALPSVESELRSIWNDIASSVRRDSFPPRTSRLCDWCSFRDRCPAFQAGASL